MTIIEAIKEVIKREAKPLTAKQIYDKIVEYQLYLFSAKDPRGVVAGQIRRHCTGIEFPTSNPVKHFILVGSNQYDIKNESDSININKSRSDENDQLPEERIHSVYQLHKNNIKQNLINTILKTDPAFFEQLVVDLLLKMGYGSNGTSKKRGGTGDGGIDGEILQDQLGFDKIYIQAKRYSKNPIGRPAIQQFVGALENITKGVFLTTSQFTQNAIDYASKQQQKTLVLIDGEKLTDLMICHGVGIQEVKIYKTYKIDQDYFS